MEKHPDTKSLIDTIAAERLDHVLDVLASVHSERQGLIELPYTFKSGSNALIYDMALLVLELMPKRKDFSVPTALHEILRLAHKEITIIYSAIKEVGLADYTVNGEDRTQERWIHAALERFDFSPLSFKAIKREYLEDTKHYMMRLGKHAEDFRDLLLQTILIDNEFGKYGRQHIESALKEVLNRQK
jgi:hypothetical protein